MIDDPVALEVALERSNKSDLSDVEVARFAVNEFRFPGVPTANTDKNSASEPDVEQKRAYERRRHN